MTDSETDQSPAEQVQAARKAFEQEFERFARFIDDSSSLAGLDLDQALAEQRALADLRTRHLGKKSALAATKKLIGRVAAADRAAFGQVVQATEAALVKSLDDADQNLKQHIETQRVARESIDVTMPGRRPRSGHRHPITLLRERVEDIFVALAMRLKTIGRSKPTSITSTRSTFRNIIRRAHPRTRSTPLKVSRYARKPPPFRFTRCRGVACQSG